MKIGCVSLTVFFLACILLVASAVIDQGESQTPTAAAATIEPTVVDNWPYAPVAQVQFFQEGTMEDLQVAINLWFQTDAQAGCPYSVDFEYDRNYYRWIAVLMLRCI